MLSVRRLAALRLGSALALVVLAAVLFPTLSFSQTTKPAGVWINATSNVGGNKWGYAGITTMAAVPGTGQVIAGVSEAGLWESEDGGKSWVKLGQSDVVQILNRPYQIVFDPKDPKTFWETGNSDGPGLFKTTDGGKTFAPIGNVAQVDGLGIDFSDPQRKTLVIGHHEQPRSVEKSMDGGLSWLKIGQMLPDNFNFTSDVVLIDANTIIVNAAGWQKEAAFGIFRTEDGGKTWTRVSDAGPSGIPCVASDGAIYWQALWAKGLVKSSDQGKKWDSPGGPVKDNPIELPGQKLVSFVERQLYASADGAVTWEKFGPEMPFKPSGICYNAKTRTLYAWRSTEGKEDNVIVKWEMNGGGS